MEDGRDGSHPWETDQTRAEQTRAEQIVAMCQDDHDRGDKEDGAVSLRQSVIPTVLDQSARGERAFDIYSLLLRERIVFLGQEVDDQIANLLVAEILYLEAEDPEQGHLPLHQLARRPRLRGHGHLRRHPARALRSVDRLRGHGHVGGGHDPVRGRARASAWPSPTQRS